MVKPHLAMHGLAMVTSNPPVTDTGNATARRLGK